MITVIAGGKRPTGWQLPALSEYEKRLRKPYDLKWRFLSEEKLAKYLDSWSFSSRDFVIVCDERGKNISSDEYSQMLKGAFLDGKNVVILIGGAYGFDSPFERVRLGSESAHKGERTSEMVRRKADFVWGFSKLVFPHAIARLIVAEQTYRAQEIALGKPYHHG